MAAQQAALAGPRGEKVADYIDALDDFIPGVQPRTGSTNFLEFAKDGDRTIFV